MLLWGRYWDMFQLCTSWNHAATSFYMSSYMLLNTVLHPLSFKIILLMCILPSTRLQMLKKRECLICLCLRYYLACKCSINCFLMHRREYFKSSYLNATEFIRPLLWAGFDIKKKGWECEDTGTFVPAHTPTLMGQEKDEDTWDRLQMIIFCAEVSSRKGDASLISGYLLDCHNIALFGACSASNKRRVTLCGFGFSGT